MSLPQTAAGRGFRTVVRLLSSAIFLLLAVMTSKASQLPLVCNPSSLQFGDVQVGNSRSLSVAVTNRGPDGITLQKESVSGAGFSLDGITTPLVLQPGESFTFGVTFTPLSATSVTGDVQGTDSRGRSLALPLSGTGLPSGQLISFPQTMNFGNVRVGETAQREGVLSASGGSVTVYSSNSNSIEFTSSGLTFPMTVAQGQSVPYVVVFRPQRQGKAAASLSFRSNAADFPEAQSLSGDGLPPQSYTVGLSWQAPSGSQVSGYNVYRGIDSGGPYSKINTILDPDTSYVDNGVVNETTYYYVTTAVNSEGLESTYSNQAKVTIP